MNNHQTPSRGPTSRCNTYATILPLLDEPGIDPDARAEARAHVATCASCQQQRAAYRQVELAARRHLGPPVSPHYQTEEIMRDLLGEPLTAPDKSGTATPAPRHARKSVSTRRVLAGVPSLAAVLVVVLLAVILFANHVRPTGGTAPAPFLQQNRLSDVSMVSASEGWAVGSTMRCGTPPGSPTPSTPESACRGGVLLLHYLNGAWTSVPNSFPVGGLSTVWMLSATDGWAAGNTIIVHYDGHTWRETPNPAGLILNRMQMLSDTDGWAIGSSGGDMYEPGLLIHYDGKSWTPEQLPASLGINKQVVMAFDDVAMISPDEGWASGTIFGGALSQVGVILHYLHGQWTVQYLLNNAGLGSLSLLSASDGWATGDTVTNTTTPVNDTPTPIEASHPLLLHYIQGKWTNVTDSLNNVSDGIGQIAMLSATDGWMIGPNDTTMLHYNGQQWLPVSLPGAKNLPVIFLRMQLLSATEGWAVGMQIVGAQAVPNGHGVGYRGGNLATLILHFHNGVWSVYTSP